MLEGIQKFIIYLEVSSKLLQHDFSSDLTLCLFPSLIKKLASKRICQSAVNDFYILGNICTNKILYKITWHVSIIILFSFLADNQSYKLLGKHSLLRNFNVGRFFGVCRRSAINSLQYRYVTNKSSVISTHSWL